MVYGSPWSRICDYEALPDLIYKDLKILEITRQT